MNATIDKRALRDAESLAIAIGQAIRPEPRVSTPEWCAKNVALGDSGARWTPWPWQAGLLAAFDEPGVKKISVAKSARVGGSQIGNASVLRSISKGLSIGVLLPREADCLDYSSNTLAPAIARCRPIADMARRSMSARGKEHKAAGTETRQTLLNRSFSNKSIVRMLAATSPDSARRISLDVLFENEIDAYAVSLGSGDKSEGDALRLFERRLGASIGGGLIYAASTPTGQDSVIWREYLAGDQRRWFCPCPDCGHSAPLEPENLVIDGRRVVEMGKSDLADLQARPGGWEVEYSCSKCGSCWPETQKRAVLASGEWRPTSTPLSPGRVSFHINALMSLFAAAAWQELASEAMLARGAAELEMVVENTLWGRRYNGSIDRDLNEQLLQQLAADIIDSEGRVDEACADIVCGVDVQQDRFEVTWLARGADQDGQIITSIVRHEKIMGIDPTDPKAWERLDTVTSAPIPSRLGGEITPNLVVVDSGNWTQQVYAECADRRHWRAVKGVAGPRPAWLLSSRAIAHGKPGAKLHLVGVDTVKVEILTAFAAKPEHRRRLRIDRRLTENQAYLEELLSEERVVVRDGKRKAKIAWQRKPGRRAEALDCFVYALAGFASYGSPSPEYYKKRREQLSTAGEDLESAFAMLAREARKLGGLD